MRLLHIANTDLEFELAEPQTLPLEKGLRRNSIVQQLQFLPLLYKEKGEGFCVTDVPIEKAPCHLLSDHSFPYDQVESWGHSRAVAKWAKDHDLTYHMPPWDVVKQVNSKAFSFACVDPLPQAELITSMDVLEKWIKKTEGPRVLKNCFGLSGQGHLLLPCPSEKIKLFAEREFQASRPIIAEPWVARTLDFSTQWMIGKNQEVSYVGSTILQSDEKGRYSGNLVGNEEKIFGMYFSKLQKHKEIALPILKKMALLGFFGNVGIDAMIWDFSKLHPVVEINARKTMGWVALQIAKRLFPNQTIKVSYLSQGRTQPLLPQGIIKPNGEVMKFHRNLFAHVLA